MKLLNLIELSEKLNISKTTLTKLLKDGSIQGKKLGRKWYTTEQAVLEYVESKKLSPITDAINYCIQHQEEETDEEKKFVYMSAINALKQIQIF